MDKAKLNGFIAWIKQPSTIKAIVMFAALIGFAVDETYITEIIVGATTLYAGIAAFYDKN